MDLKGVLYILVFLLRFYLGKINPDEMFDEITVIRENHGVTVMFKYCGEYPKCMASTSCSFSRSKSSAQVL